MSEMLSRESLDKRKINRIVVVHSPKKSYSRVTSQRKPSFQKDWGSINHEADGSFSVLSKNMDDFDTPKEISGFELKK